MNRRQFLAYAAFGGATLAAGAAHAAVRTIELRIEPTDVELIDGRVVYMTLFYGLDESGALKPRPVLRAVEGERLMIRIVNNDVVEHGFDIPGAPGALISSISPGSSRTVEFMAPRGGTWMYLDPQNAPVNRLLGLHGAMVTLPFAPRTRTGDTCPFSDVDQNAAIQALFAACSPTSTRFPGNPWRVDRDVVWVFTQIDPALHEAVEMRRPPVGASVVATFQPRYFTINGLSGHDAAEDPTIKFKGYIGEPLLIRNLNAGLVTHAPHIHGNHVLQLSSSDAQGRQIVLDNLLERDTWRMRPLERADLLIPFERPNDIPLAAWPPRQEPFPMRYPMHCHIEMSQTAGGGNYPQGLITDWELLGPARPTAA